MVLQWGERTGGERVCGALLGRVEEGQFSTGLEGGMIHLMRVVEWEEWRGLFVTR